MALTDYELELARIFLFLANRLAISNQEQGVTSPYPEPMERRVWFYVKPYFFEYLHARAEQRAAKLKQALAFRRRMLLSRIGMDWFDHWDMPALTSTSSSDMD